MRRAPARSRPVVVNDHPPTKSASGVGVKRCNACCQSMRRTKETIHNGLLVIRVRYGLPYAELPDCGPESLSRFLNFLLLQGKVRDPVAFPRRQGRKDSSGLCSLQRLGRKERWGLAHSVSSIKRNLPAGCPHHTPSVRKAWESIALSQPPPTSAEYLAHVRRVATRIFTPGWDKDYLRFVGEHVPNPTSRRPLLSRADLLWAGRREEFISACVEETDLCPVFSARYKEVQSAGKKRPLLIYDERSDLLAPLHKLVYSHLARRTDWLLVGPPCDERMSSVLVNEYQTSVDLVAATDGLAHDVSEALLDCMFFTSVKIPRSLRSLAKASFSPVFRDGKGVYQRVRHGQMMGSYLSFPLLCLHSYCAASWAARDCEDARFLVNGDDTVISAGREIGVQDYPSGYRLNTDKTIRAKNVAELNSTVFLKVSGRWREVRHLRRGGAPADYSGMMHMAKAAASTRSWTDAFTRCRIGRRWGFLPSQIGHLTYSSYKRERTMLLRRAFSKLPEQAKLPVNASLRRISGRDPTPLEIEAHRAFMWANGRDGGLKRDVYEPSCGHIRRTYAYRVKPAWSYESFVSWCKKGVVPPWKKGPSFFFVPDDFETEEESLGLFVLDLWRQALDSLVGEGGR